MILQYLILSSLGFTVFLVDESLAQNRQLISRTGNSYDLPAQVPIGNNSDEEPPYIFVLVGASGDLAKREIYPALWQLYRDGLLPKDTRILGISRTERTLGQIREAVRHFVQLRGPVELRRFEDDFWDINDYFAINIATEDGSTLLAQLLEKGGTQANRLFYLALPPASFAEAATGLARATLRAPTIGWTRLVVEKPFGRDAPSSRRLSDQLGGLFAEEQLYRMDHFLGEEMVQGLVALRFANRILEPSWNHEIIVSVHLDFRENLGVEGRGGYFDENGIIRDVVQNHLLQVIALIAMEKPASYSSDDIR